MQAHERNTGGGEGAKEDGEGKPSEKKASHYTYKLLDYVYLMHISNF